MIRRWLVIKHLLFGWWIKKCILTCQKHNHWVLLLTVVWLFTKWLGQSCCLYSSRKITYTTNKDQQSCSLVALTENLSKLASLTQMWLLLDWSLNAMPWCLNVWTCKQPTDKQFNQNNSTFAEVHYQVVTNLSPSVVLDYWHVH